MIIAGSFTSETVLARTGYSFWPAPFSLDAYTLLFSGQSLLNGYISSLFITIVGTALSLSCTACLSWVIARQLPRISRPLTIFAYIPMLFTGGLVPLYLLVTQVLKLNDSWFAVIFPIMLAPFLVFVAVSFFRQLPRRSSTRRGWTAQVNCGSSSRSSSRCLSRSSPFSALLRSHLLGTSGSTRCCSCPTRTSSRCS